MLFLRRLLWVFLFFRKGGAQAVNEAADFSRINPGDLHGCG